MTNEIKYKRPRYEYIKNKVAKLCVDFNINSYPVNVKQLICEIPNCKIVPYSEIIKKLNITASELYAAFNTDEGCAYYEHNSKEYIIFYNDLKIGFIYIKTPERQRWTLAHELGHILLEHHVLTDRTRIFRNALTDEEYNWMESEANHFASLLLANPIILYRLQIKDSKDIAKICGLSMEASLYRFENYKKWKLRKRINSRELLMLLQFHDFIYKKYCSNCGYGVISKEYTYCPICGQKLQWGDGNMKYNDGYELDENGRALICPRCGNEQIGDSPEEQFCMICGTYLVNKCTNFEGKYVRGQEIEPPCGNIVPGNARFCPSCGAETTFFTDGLLQPWEEAKKKIEQETKGKGIININKYQDESESDDFEGFTPLDDELPF